jgi:V8-like Glu-specific endopeptidase
MPKAIKTRKAHSSHGAHGAAPFSPEHILRLEDEPDKPMPADVKSELSAAKYYISGVANRRDLDECVSAAEGHKSTWALRLPDHVSAGLPGRSGERLDRNKEIVAKGATTAPRRPHWSGLAYQPRLAQAFHHNRIRTIGQRTIEPYYGIYDNPDARQVYYPFTYPWRCTGRIFTYTTWPTPNWAWSGSGALVGPRHVLTAGHVAPWGASPWAMLFVPAYWDGASIFGAGAQSYVSDYRGWNTGTVAAHDSCVLRLYEPLGNQLGWIGTRTYDGAWEGGNYWSLTGYPGAIAGANRPVFQNSVAALDDDEDGDAQEIEHHGDSSPGESGGPMFGFWNDGPHAIGTTSGGETISGGIFGIGNEDNNIAAGGSAMVDLVRWAQTNWP